MRGALSEQQEWVPGGEGEHPLMNLHFLGRSGGVHSQPPSAEFFCNICCWESTGVSDFKKCIKSKASHLSEQLHAILPVVAISKHQSITEELAKDQHLAAVGAVCGKEYCIEDSLFCREKSRKRLVCLWKESA